MRGGRSAEMVPHDLHRGCRPRCASAGSGGQYRRHAWRGSTDETDRDRAPGRRPHGRSTRCHRDLGWCGIFDDSQKPVRTFERYRGDAGNGHWIRGGTSILHCGSSAKWGLRHIEAGHQSQWEYDAWLVGVNWRNQTDAALAVVLRDPDRVTYNSANNTFCDSRLIHLVHKSDRRVADERWPNVVVSGGSKNSITAFPSDANCGASR